MGTSSLVPVDCNTSFRGLFESVSAGCVDSRVFPGPAVLGVGRVKTVGDSGFMRAGRLYSSLGRVVYPDWGLELSPAADTAPCSGALILGSLLVARLDA